MKHSNYHRCLRVSALVCSFVLLFESGLLSSSTAQISRGTHAYVATAVGMSAGVDPTELNTFTAELTQQKRELEAREAALKEREISVNLNDGSVVTNDTTTYVLASILFILLLLILLNYVLDYIRIRENREMQTV